jgi:tetratricopeptide (TPR) repeat protein
MKKIFIYICFVLLFSGCVATDETSDLSKVDVNNIAEKLKELDETNERFEVSREVDDRDQAISLAKEILIVEPDHFPVQVVLYRMTAEKALMNQNYELVEELRKQWNEHPGLKETDFAPPSLVGVFIQLRAREVGDSKSSLKKKLNQALREKPGYPRAAAMLSKIYYSEGRESLAANVLKRAVDLNPDHVKLNEDLGMLYYKLGKKQHCDSFDNKYYGKSITYLKKSLELDSTNPKVHYRLALAYERTGRGALYLHEAKMYEKHRGDKGSKTFIGRALLWNMRFNGAIEIYLSELEKEPDNLGTLKFLARAYLAEKQYQQSVDTWEKYHSLDESPYFYGYLLQSLALLSMEESTKARTILEKLSDHSELSDWERMLLRYHVGQLSQNKLLESAQNWCQETEANFYIGYQYYLESNQVKAKEYFQRVLELGNYPFVEYVLARNLNKQL